MFLCLAEQTDPIREPEHDAVKNESIEEIENPILEKRRNFRKNIKKVMVFANLTPETKLAFRKETERKKEYVKRLQKVKYDLLN